MKSIWFLRRNTTGNNYNDWEMNVFKTTTIWNHNNYNDWEKIVIKTTTNGIPMVVVNYNEWE